MVSNEQEKHWQLLVVRHIFGTVKKIALYKWDHPTVQQSLQESYRQISAVFVKADQATISRTNDTIVVEGLPLEKDNPYYKDITIFFNKLRIESITLYRGLSLQELGLFFKILLAKQESIEKKGGIVGVLTKTGVKHLSINQATYEKVSDEQKVVGADQVYEISDINTDKSYDVTEPGQEADSLEGTLKDEIRLYVQRVT